MFFAWIIWRMWECYMVLYGRFFNSWWFCFHLLDAKLFAQTTIPVIFRLIISSSRYSFSNQRPPNIKFQNGNQYHFICIFIYMCIYKWIYIMKLNQGYWSWPRRLIPEEENERRGFYFFTPHAYFLVQYCVCVCVYRHIMIMGNTFSWWESNG